MRVKLWGVRGSVPVPNESMLGYGGNTACVEVTLEDGTEIILDAGTGIRELGAARAARTERLEILLTHLHVDHIHGLLFFPPLFDPANQVTVYGPPAPGPNLDQRLSRYLSPPLSPIDLRELPAQVDFRACPYEQWQIGTARVEAALVAHRGVTLGYRITEGDTSLCYIPDHEPALGGPLADADPGWISGSGLATGASLLIHDGQYFDDEYSDHVGWGHSSVSDAISFAQRTEAERLVLFHHDPLHDDSTLDRLQDLARDRWGTARAANEVSLAVEGTTIEL
jgi:phosphoribosyl 1,2-cyclic phosphodiesterase